MKWPDFSPKSSREPARPPVKCPFCGSTSITTQSKAPDAQSYWRCTRCGEMWNPARKAGRQ